MGQGRRKAAIYAFILTFGLLAGFAIRANVDRLLARQHLALAEGDRATVALQLFEAFCIGALRGKPLDPQPSLKPANLQGEAIWYEPGTDLHLSLKLPLTCSVSDALRPLSAPEKERLAKAIADSIPVWTPELSPRVPDDLGFFVLKAWTTPDDHPKPRWGIVMSQVEESGPNAFTVLSLGLPHD
ncbi:hypothetical protein [Tabrizicola sp. M-4]|uniref:hypothetical protein n=1 Tax=Tabrizicola sp. M-4 TaxID=3055847 RepID=UPI003DA8DA57